MAWFKLKLARWMIRNPEWVTDDLEDWAYRYYNSH